MWHSTPAPHVGALSADSSEMSSLPLMCSSLPPLRQVGPAGHLTFMWTPHASSTSYLLYDRAPACGVGVACHINKCDKNITQTSLRWHSCRCHSKNDNSMSVICYNGKNVKTPIIGDGGSRHLLVDCSHLKCACTMHVSRQRTFEFKDFRN